MMQTAGISPKLSSFVGSSPGICDAMFVAATRDIVSADVSAGNPVSGTPTAFSVRHGALRAGQEHTCRVQPRLARPESP